MITINHALSGYVCARVAMPLASRHAAVTERALGWAAALGAAMPDVDILTRLLLGRSHYFTDVWYGHRAASHSVLGTLLMALLGAALIYPLLREGSTRPGMPAYAWLVGAFWFGGLLHLVGDLFTPGWALPLLWPGELRFGGFRHIGWFTPYLLWLFFATVILAWGLNALPWGLKALAPLSRRFRPHMGLCAWGVYALAAWRWLHFMIASRYQSRSQWMDAQFDLLPEAMIVPLTRGVSTVWYWLTG